MKQEDYKEVSLPDFVRVSVDELHQLQQDSALLAALRIAKVEKWQGYKYATWVFEHDPTIQDIKLGWKRTLEEYSTG